MNTNYKDYKNYSEHEARGSSPGNQNRKSECWRGRSGVHTHSLRVSNPCSLNCSSCFIQDRSRFSLFTWTSKRTPRGHSEDTKRTPRGHREDTKRTLKGHQMDTRGPRSSRTHPTLGRGDFRFQDVGVVLAGRGRPGVHCGDGDRVVRAASRPTAGPRLYPQLVWDVDLSLQASLSCRYSSCARRSRCSFTW